MNEYRILIPIGGQLPQAGAVIQSKDTDYKGERTLIQVSTITGITWGTKTIDGKDKVAGIFVELLGMPYPQIKLTPEAEKARAKYKHFIVYDAISGEAKACFNGDDKTQEVVHGKCPVCKKRKKDQEAAESARQDIAGLAAALVSRGISIDGCRTYEDLVKRIIESSTKPKKRTRKKAAPEEGKAERAEGTTEAGNKE